MTDLTITELNDLYAKTYDNTAPEYEERVQQLLKVTKEALGIFVKHVKRNGHILDIGCAVGYTTEILRKAGFKLDGIDISPKMVHYAQKRNPDTNILLGDFLTTEFDEKYDGILAFAFIHLFPKDYAIKCIEKMMNLLKPDGVIFLTTSKSETASEGLEHKADYRGEHQRYRKRWTQAEFEAMIDDAGLEIVEKIFPVDAMGKTWMDFVVKPKAS